MPHRTLDACPLCGGALQATVTQTLDEVRTSIDALGKPYQTEGTPQIEANWNIYCKNGHDWRKILWALRAKEPTT